MVVSKGMHEILTTWIHAPNEENKIQKKLVNWDNLHQAKTSNEDHWLESVLLRKKIFSD